MDCVTYNQVFISGYKWGYIFEGVWTGMMGELIRDEVDLGMANLFLNFYRYETVSLSTPFSHEVCVLAFSYHTY